MLLLREHNGDFLGHLSKERWGTSIVSAKGLIESLEPGEKVVAPYQEQRPNSPSQLGSGVRHNRELVSARSCCVRLDPHAIASYTTAKKT
jgi:hypothetical protein